MFRRIVIALAAAALFTTSMVSGTASADHVDITKPQSAEQCGSYTKISGSSRDISKSPHSGLLYIWSDYKNPLTLQLQCDGEPRVSEIAEKTFWVDVKYGDETDFFAKWDRDIRFTVKGDSASLMNRVTLYDGSKRGKVSTLLPAGHMYKVEVTHSGNEHFLTVNGQLIGSYVNKLDRDRVVPVFKFKGGARTSSQNDPVNFIFGLENSEMLLK
jgi:hypothetical protein